MRGAKSAKWVVGAIVVALAATACGGGNDNKGSDAKGGGVFRMGITEPTAIDPVNAQESEGMVIARALFTQLYDVSVDGKLIPKLAESGTSADGKTWIFKIKSGTKFTNGEVVDAEAFIRGWTRVAAKASASDVSYHMAGIKGYDALKGGKSDKFAGLSAPDANTLKVELDKADFEFDKKTAHAAFSPVPKVAGAGDNKKFNDAPIGNGAFKMKGSWNHNQSISLVRNDDYGLEKAKLDGVEFKILNPANGSQLEYTGFQSGEFDYARMPTPQLPVAKAKFEPQGEWYSADFSGINYLVVFNQNAPFNNPDARKAISYAIDREAIAKSVFQGMQKPATAFLPPSFSAEYQAGVCSTCVKQDKAKAKEFAAKGGLKPGTVVNFGYNTGAGHEEWVQAVAQQLKDVLGVEVKLDGKPFKEALATQQEKKTSGLWRSAWTADYPTADNFLAPLLSTAGIGEDPATGKAQGDNRSRYSNPKFDELLDQARQEKDAAKRAELYKQAEKLAIDTDQAVVPLWQRTQYRLVNTKKFDGIKMDFFEDPTLAEISLKK
ncbi:peptide ABC transporter substrate-binding protein [Streptomyces litmocidini]|uniref:peptide ABC transporter substrate-binding protein n=1 Tax=Streptomyces litmocidini TaxID=67318 RepID=UPI00167DA37E|nr:peptide ABC transporter substrate-binding protein [Streptomyces litmocidini]GGU72692.1 peptide ABC transporter substrate-binding protein [Streptomyces litmocidini]